MIMVEDDRLVELKKRASVIRGINLFVSLPLVIVFYIIIIVAFFTGNQLVANLACVIISIPISISTGILAYLYYKNEESFWSFLYVTNCVIYGIIFLLYVVNPPLPHVTPQVVVDVIYANGTGILSNGTYIDVFVPK